MEIDALIEQLAFGKTTPKLSRCIGVFLSPEVIYVTETRMVKGKVAVDHLVRVPVPVPETAKEPTTSPTLVTEFLSDIPKLSALIRQSTSQLRWNSKDVVVTLSHHLGLLRYFTMPAVDRRFWRSAVPLEAKKYIPVPLDMLSVDYQVVPMAPGPDKRPRQAALVACVPSRTLPNISGLVESLGYRPVGIEVAPCSVLRLWNSVDPGKVREPYCHVHFDGGNVRVLISDKGLPVFFREVFMGPEAYVSDSRRIDLAGCVAFAQKQLGVGNVAQLVVSGSTPELAGWKDAFAQELGMPVETQDTAGLLGIKGGDWGGYASIGAALRYITASPITLELSPVGKIGDGERLAAKYIFGASIAAAVAISGLGLWQESILKWKSRTLKQYAPQPDIELVFKDKGKMDIENMMAVMRDQAGALPDLTEAGAVRVVPILKAIVDALPEKVWLTKISVVNPLRSSQSQGREIRLTGNAMGINVGEEQKKALDYKDALAKSPVLSKFFDEFSIEVRRQVTTSTADGGGAAAGETDREGYRRKQEQRTMFDIALRVRKKT